MVVVERLKLVVTLKILGVLQFYTVCFCISIVLVPKVIKKVDSDVLDRGRGILV